jgi:hypothetical protein
MKIIKPQRLGLLPKPYSFAGKHYLCVGTLVFFELGAERAPAEVLPEQRGWALASRL